MASVTEQGRLLQLLLASLAVLLTASALGCSSGSPAAPQPEPTPTPSAVPTGPPTIALDLAWGGLDEPVYVTGAGDGTGRVFIREKGGRIRLVKGGRLQARSFLDVSDIVSSGGERGLLGLAFPPGFSPSGHFYIDYTDRNGDTHVARVGMTTDPDVADKAGMETILSVQQPFPNHNGGQLAFGPDGYLYVGLGDGGSAGDPGNRGQDPSTLLAKILRLDTEHGTATYTVPSDNPYVGQPRWRGETWALGLRNPWRFSFDRRTGDLWIGDVGQNAWEEIDFQPAGSRGGLDYGWSRFEGTHPYDTSRRIVTSEAAVMPVYEYSHAIGDAVTGGYVYRGSAYPSLQGWYVFGDYGSGLLFGLRRQGNTFKSARLLDSNANISSFGEDDRGELYLCDLQGAVYRVTAR